MPNTPRMAWPYPAENQKAWFDAFVAFASAMDASGYAAREDRHLVLFGGGTIAWDAGTSTLSWTTALKLTAATTGLLWSVSATSLTVDDGQAVYVNLTRAPTSAVSASAIAASKVPNTDAACLLAVRSGDTIVWRNGVLFADGTSTADGIAPSISGGGGPVPDTAEVLNGPLNESQSGTVELHVGSIYLQVDTRLLSASAAMLGGVGGGDTGNLRLRRFTGGTLIATWSNTGPLASTPLGADVDITVSDWYDLYLYSGGALEGAVVKGIRLLVQTL